ncbi:MAG: arsenosugar biosynthesis radical SAM (seleno)protein ArsS [Polyangiales bacterium]
MSADRFAARVRRSTGDGLAARSISTLQINVGKLCNQACKHCHVDAGPNRSEQMDERTARACVDALERGAIGTLDITGGAPELNPHFRYLVDSARARGVRVMVRHNLTVQFEPGCEDLPEYFQRNHVEVISSLPHFDGASTDRQRGAGVFDKSVRALRALNERGYGKGDPALPLALVHNPVGAILPGSQAALEDEYRKQLSARWGVTFDRLFVLTNMPIQRFRAWLERTEQLEEYQQTLETAFNPSTVAALMCRDMISVSWDGNLYDCDFNQMLELPVQSASRTIFDADFAPLKQRSIATGEHCFGCTAGGGSSCGGQLSE